MNINNKNLVTHVVYLYNPVTRSSYSPAGTIQCLKHATDQQLLDYVNQSFPKPASNCVYVIAKSGYAPNYNPKLYDSNTMNKTSINSVQALLQATNANGFIVASFSVSGGFSMSAEPVVHTTAALARQEAKRLATLNPGKYYVFLQVRGGEFVQPQPTSTSF